MKKGKIRTIGLGAAGLLLLPVFAASASATDADGGFTIKAEDAKDSEVVALVGRELPAGNTPGSGLPGDGTSNGSNPGDVSADDGTRIAFSYQCGPMSIDVTEGMIERSQKNWDAVQSGDLSAVIPDPSGWTTIVETTEVDMDVFVDSPITADAKPGNIYMKDSIGASLVNAGGNGDNCQMTDVRDLSLSGNFVKYTLFDSGSGLTDQGAKIVDIDGETFLQEHRYETYADGRASERIWTTSPTASAAWFGESSTRSDLASHVTINSADYPFDSDVSSDRKYEIGSQDGYVLRVLEYSDGSTAEAYSDRAQSKPANGAPAIAKFDGAGNFIAYGEYNEDLSISYTSSTLQQWNQLNGSSWDGKATGVEGIKGTTLAFDHSREFSPIGL